VVALDGLAEHVRVITQHNELCWGRRHNHRNSLLSISKLADWDKDEPMGAIGTNYKIIYWQRELPPFGADAVDVIEATSNRVPGTLLHRDEL